MRIRPGNGLIPLNILVIILILAIVLFPFNVIRIILGIPFLIFFPGYTLMAALFAKKEGVGSIERVTLSFVLSIAVVSLIGLILNYTYWGIRLEPIIYSVASFTLITSFVAWLRQRRLPKHERFAIQLQVPRLSWGRGWHKVFTITLVIAILGALGTLGYFIATPKEGETLTDFYILGQEGKAVNYPIEMKLGEEGRVILGIVNHEGKDVSYRVEVAIDGKKSTRIGPVALASDQKWEEEVGFVPEMPAERQKVEFLLYKDDEAEPYLEPLFLWVDVSE